MKHKYSIVYMGTPEFAIAPLQKLIENQYKISAVVTVADKPAGRGLKMHSSPVKEFALQHNLTVLQPLKLSDPEFLAQLKEINADLFIVVAFRKLPEVVWKMPPLGCFNLHASLLPQYRGAAPINHAIINGETETGVTTFFLNDEIDKGRIIKQHRIAISANETAGELHDRLKNIGAGVVQETVDAIFTNNFSTIDQEELVNKSAIDVSNPGQALNIDKTISGSIKNAPKIFRSDCRINWHQSALNVHNFIRGLSPFPGAYSEMLTDDIAKEIKVLKSALTGIQSDQQPGFVTIRDGRMLISCLDECLELLTIQPFGKKAMPVAEFLRGNRGEINRFQ